MSRQPRPASEPEARQALLRDLDHAIVLMTRAKLIVAEADVLTREDFQAVAHLCGESRQVPLTIALHDLADFYFKRD